MDLRDAYLASPADFTGVDDIITNLAKEREPGDIERTPSSLIITSINNSFYELTKESFHYRERKKKNPTSLL